MPTYFFGQLIIIISVEELVMITVSKSPLKPSASNEQAYS